MNQRELIIVVCPNCKVIHTTTSDSKVCDKCRKEKK